MIIHLLRFIIPICLMLQPVASTQHLRTLFHRLRAFSHNPSLIGGSIVSKSATKIAHSPSSTMSHLNGHRFISSTTVRFGTNGLSTSNHAEIKECNTAAVAEHIQEEHAQFKKDFGLFNVFKNSYESMSLSEVNPQNEVNLHSQKVDGNTKFDEVQIRIIQFPQFNSLERQIREVGKEVGKIMEKIMEIRVNVEFGAVQNYEGNGNKMVKHLELNGRDLMAKFVGQKMHGRIEMGQTLIRAICGGPECDIHTELPEFRVDPCSVKPEHGEDELDRALRPMLLKLAAKWQKGSLWVDNPNAEYRNIFEIAYEMAPGILKSERRAIEVHLANIELNSPFFFRPIDGSVRETENNPRAVKREDREKFRHRIQFFIHGGESDAPNGLQRDAQLQVVKINDKLLNDNRHVHQLMQKALGVDCGEGLRILYDRRDEYMHVDRQQFAQLNAAYGGENYYMIGGPRLFSPDRKRILDKWESSFWTEYANFETRKYEIPLVYDESFVKQAEEHKELIDYVFKTFEEKSVIKFVVYKNHHQAKIMREFMARRTNWISIRDIIIQFTNKNYKNLYRYKAHAHVGCLDRNTFWKKSEYSGQIVGFGKKSMGKYELFHELLHTCGLQHEHQRADVTRFVDYEAEHIKEIWGINDDYIEVNFPVLSTYLPVNRYNPTSIMHYANESLKPIWAGPDWVSRLQKWKNIPDEPEQMDWENLNHFYGVGKGRTKLTVKNDKIVDDIGGQRRLRRK